MSGDKTESRSGEFQPTTEAISMVEKQKAEETKFFDSLIYSYCKIYKEFSGEEDEDDFRHLIEVVKSLSPETLQDTDKRKRLITTIAKVEDGIISGIFAKKRSEVFKGFFPFNEKQSQEFFDAFPKDLRDEAVIELEADVLREKMTTSCGVTVKFPEFNEERFGNFMESVFFSKDILKRIVGEMMWSIFFKGWVLAKFSFEKDETFFVQKLLEITGLSKEEFKEGFLSVVLEKAEKHEDGLDLYGMENVAKVLGLSRKVFFDRLPEKFKDMIKKKGKESFLYRFPYFFWLVKEGFLTAENFSSEELKKHTEDLYLKGGSLDEEEKAFVSMVVGEEEVESIISSAKRIIDTGTKLPVIYKELEDGGYSPEATSLIIDYFSGLEDDSNEKQFKDPTDFFGLEKMFLKKLLVLKKN